MAPTLYELQAALAQAFLDNHGPRRLLSFIQRCSLEGPWKETIRKRDKDGKAISYSVLELELSQLLKQEDRLSTEQAARLNELLHLMTLSLVEKSDAELNDICVQWIERTRLMTVTT